MPHTRSTLCNARIGYQPKLPSSLKNGLTGVVVEKGEATESVADQEKIKALFPNTYGAPVVKFKSGAAEGVRPLTVGAVLSGGQAPGGHNVISGIYDGVKSASKESRVLGFLNGPGGLVDGKFMEIDDELMDKYRNSGGFDLIGSGRTKLEDESQFKACIEVANKNNLDAIVVIGGDDSNTNAAVLAEYFKTNNVACSVVGCPKTIDGDLKNKHIETPFGFDTAAKTYASLIGNIARDANSAKKYWHFVKLMGRSASHIGLEVALQTQPNVCLISEEVEAKQMTLGQVVAEIADVVEARAAEGKNFGVALIPEGLVEFIPEMKALIKELNDALVGCEAEVEAASKVDEKVAIISKHLSEDSAAVLMELPEGIQAQLLLDRDPHGNVQVSLIETEKLLIELVGKEVKKRPGFKGKFKALNHFFGYEGRCAHPSNFDSDYAYALGYSAAVLAQNKLTGYISSVSNLKSGVDNWEAGGVPTSMLMNIERRHGEDKPVIQKALVDLEGPAFKKFAEHRDEWAKTESYLYPGAIQYFGPPEVCDAITETLKLGA
ncbi:MAG: diphosphate--fructose-6-phosphate 1-phosphotransferase [Deltaproteobacteria bacterium]|nr:diphosphate--fructose-6-phosphate 1-phosphotransferase [Deltaproteobacteria bacterium]MBN2672004.1 diphosphate--fructose-6-phosphate 1-phosphotransferase [Deltaproteobacteria bacterium]